MMSSAEDNICLSALLNYLVGKPKYQACLLSKPKLDVECKKVFRNEVLDRQTKEILAKGFQVLRDAYDIDRSVVQNCRRRMLELLAISTGFVNKNLVTTTVCPFEEIINTRRLGNEFYTMSHDHAESPPQYEKAQYIGGGSFGNVYRAFDRKTKSNVALKAVALLDGDNFSYLAKKELTILQKLLRGHKHVVRLLNICVAHTPHQEQLLMVFELCRTDLRRYFGEHCLSSSQVKFLMKGILGGVQFLHSKCVVHCDLKPENILLTSDHVPKIADFGLSQIKMPYLKLNKRVGTRSYESPEMNLGASYGFPTDMWSLGCVFAECHSRRPLLRSKDRIGQLRKIIQLCHLDLVQSWTIWPEENAYDLSYGMMVRQYFKDLIGTYPLRGLEELKEDDWSKQLFWEMMRFDQTERITSDEALKHRYFADVASSYPPFNRVSHSDDADLGTTSESASALSDIRRLFSPNKTDVSAEHGETPTSSPTIDTDRPFKVDKDHHYFADVASRYPTFNVVFGSDDAVLDRMSLIAIPSALSDIRRLYSPNKTDVSAEHGEISTPSPTIDTDRPLKVDKDHHYFADVASRYPTFNRVSGSDGAVLDRMSLIAIPSALSDIRRLYSPNKTDVSVEHGEISTPSPTIDTDRPLKVDKDHHYFADVASRYPPFNLVFGSDDAVLDRMSLIAIPSALSDIRRLYSPNKTDVSVEHGEISTPSPTIDSDRPFKVDSDHQYFADFGGSYPPYNRVSDSDDCVRGTMSLIAIPSALSDIRRLYSPNKTDVSAETGDTPTPSLTIDSDRPFKVDSDHQYFADFGGSYPPYNRVSDSDDSVPDIMSLIAIPSALSDIRRLYSPNKTDVSAETGDTPTPSLTIDSDRPFKVDSDHQYFADFGGSYPPYNRVSDSDDSVPDIMSLIAIPSALSDIRRLYSPNNTDVSVEHGEISTPSPTIDSDRPFKVDSDHQHFADFGGSYPPYNRVSDSDDCVRGTMSLIAIPSAISDIRRLYSPNKTDVSIEHGEISTPSLTIDSDRPFKVDSDHQYFADFGGSYPPYNRVSDSDDSVRGTMSLIAIPSALSDIRRLYSPNKTDVSAETGDTPTPSLTIDSDRPFKVDSDHQYFADFGGSYPPYNRVSDSDDSVRGTMSLIAIPSALSDIRRLYSPNKTDVSAETGDTPTPSLTIDSDRPFKVDSDHQYFADFGGSYPPYNRVSGSNDAVLDTMSLMELPSALSDIRRLYSPNKTDVSAESGETSAR